MPKNIDITKLKDFVLNNLPRGFKLRELKLSERDTMDATTYIVMVGVWLKLLKIEHDK
jgi:cytochrome c